MGITERAVQRIVGELEEGGYLFSRSREGRRNRYEERLDRLMRHSVESNREVRVFLNLILRPDQSDPGDPANCRVATNPFWRSWSGPIFIFPTLDQSEIGFAVFPIRP